MKTNEQVARLKDTHPEWTGRKIAQTLGISESSVSRILKNCANSTMEKRIEARQNQTAKKLQELNARIAQLEKRFAQHRHNRETGTIIERFIK